MPPSLSLAAWPHAAPFGVFLSHDVDQIYDRELFKLLGDANHLRRLLQRRDAGDVSACARRLLRGLVAPKATGRDVERILSIERNHRLRSTFFLLEDDTFDRYGGRYRYGDDATKAIARRIRDAGGELGVHGAYHAFNRPDGYRAQRISLAQACGVLAGGIRNHYLRHQGESTWRAQRDAGYRYDATFGFNDDVGVREGRSHPFFPLPEDESFVALPLTIMDSALFRRMQSSFAEAMQRCRRIADEVRSVKGLLTLSWHNNHFDEPEYADWERAYEQMLSWVVEQGAWCATGFDVAEWWRRRARVRIEERERAPEFVATLVAPLAIEGLCVRLETTMAAVIEVRGAECSVVREGDGSLLRFGALPAGARAQIKVRP